ncbi:MAG TPA: crosslink repair DNA glycosylase YcaQ family protein, partial [Pyrinomonadaceae bacterium]|nr:crosslink repair DNA glycosylase YcaQ family protein [Pyrinomonadaceae bacterium]
AKIADSRFPWKLPVRYSLPLRWYPIMLINLDHLRRYTVARNFFQPTGLKRALHRMGFVQADPIRAPARAQDLILRHRVKNYQAGDLERRYPTLDVEEDFLVIYGFVTKPIHALMHPRERWEGVKGKGETNRSRLLLEFVRQKGAVHPREVDEHFAHGRVTNYWGGSSNATTHLLEDMHYRGLLRVARREKGIRIYAARSAEMQDDAGVRAGTAPLQPRAGKDARAPIDALVDLVVRLYAPLPGRSLSSLVAQLRYAVPQWQGELKNALQRAKERLSHAQVEGKTGAAEWYWPAEEDVLLNCSMAGEREPQNVDYDVVRLLAPFDPVVRDRARFELLWGWVYRFEAYTPAPKRKLGYYALPLLWRDRVIGWGNLSVKNRELNSDFGYVGTQPREPAFKRELKAELDRMRVFLGLETK